MNSKQNSDFYGSKMNRVPLLMGMMVVLVFLTGCEEKEVMNFTSAVVKEHVKQNELGRCENEAGTKVEAYTPWIPSRLIHYFFIIPKQKDSPIENCIPDLDPMVVSALTPEQKQKNRTDFNSAIKMSRSYNRIFYKTTGQQIRISLIFLELQELVRRGEELAQIELNLTDYYSNVIQRYHFDEDNPHYQRLKQLADSGDADAMCLYALRHPTPYKGYEHLKDGASNYDWYHQAPDGKFGKGVEKAAKHGAAKCMTIYAKMLAPQLASTEKRALEINRALGFEYLVRAAKKEDPTAVFLLHYAYFEKNNRFGVEPNLGKAECWLKINNRLFPKRAYSLRSIHYSANKEEGIDVSKPYKKYDDNTYCEEGLAL